MKAPLWPCLSPSKAKGWYLLVPALPASHPTAVLLVL